MIDKTCSKSCGYNFYYDCCSSFWNNQDKAEADSRGYGFGFVGGDPPLLGESESEDVSSFCIVLIINLKMSLCIVLIINLKMSRLVHFIGELNLSRLACQTAKRPSLALLYRSF